MANRDLEVLDTKIADAIIHACDKLISGEALDQFVTDFIQGRRRHLHQHERQRGDCQSRPGVDGAQEGRLPHHQPERPCELRAVDQ